MGIDLPPEKIAMKTPRHSNFLGCDNARLVVVGTTEEVVRLYTLLSAFCSDEEGGATGPKGFTGSRIGSNGTSLTLPEAG